MLVSFTKLGGHAGAGFRGLSVRGLPRGPCPGGPWMENPGCWQPSWEPHHGGALRTSIFQLNEQMFPLCSPVRIIYC